jgi:YD repeat-containing protein
MEWNVKNAINRDVERQHLNKILAEIKNSVGAIPSQQTIADTVTTIIRQLPPAVPPSTPPADSPISKTLAYDGSDRLSSVVDARGTKSFGYDGNNRLVSLAGTGVHASKIYTYNGAGQLVAVTVLP